ncbi:hypothetical protein DF186_20675, partial [Enterococcus hirae]
YDDGEIFYVKVIIGFKDSKYFTDVWIVDSGAIWYMIFHSEWFCIYESVLEGSVFMGNDYVLEIVEMGTVKIKCLMVLFVYFKG